MQVCSFDRGGKACNYQVRNSWFVLIKPATVQGLNDCLNTPNVINISDLKIIYEWTRYLQFNIEISKLDVDWGRPTTLRMLLLASSGQ